MPRENLLDLFGERQSLDAPFLVYDDGYRQWTFTSRQVAEGAFAFANRLRAAGLSAGDKVILWGENRPGWIIALWGCVLEGVLAVPIDYRSSLPFVERVAGIVGAKVVVAGDEVAGRAGAWTFDELERERAPQGAGRHRPRHEETAEILFTSGATAEPKGVLISHKNLLANLVPVETEIRKYRGHWAVRWLAEPLLFPIRFLNLLPLSHLFGQTMAAFIPPMIDGVVVFARGQSPADVARQVQRRRVSVIVCVPKMMELLRDHVLRVCPESALPMPAGGRWMGAAGFLRNWWRYRRVHRLLGWKFWAFVVGAAPLDPELEAFWRKLGYVVIQGYGLTETAPIVSVNHPFQQSHGSVGRPVAGVEVKLAEDGEILVKGDNITAGYYGMAGGVIAPDGWFHTGDVGELDEAGAIRIRGRKKEMIVTPEGLNIFPDDLERVLSALPGVVEPAVVERAGRPHAVLVLAPGAEAGEVVQAANARLEEHQRIRSHSVWTGDALPRTEGTRKLKRAAIAEWVRTGTVAAPAKAADVESVLARYAGGRTVTPSTTIEELGLGSLERVQLLMELEEKLGRTLDEGALQEAGTVEGLKKLESAPVRVEEPIAFARWARRGWARAVRRFSLPVWVLPLARLFLWVKREGVERIAPGPVIFASNHQSYMDTPAILAALPGRWRYRLAPAMRMEFFDAHFHPEKHGWAKRFRNSLGYYLATLMFHAFPLPQREAGTKQALQYAGELVSDGWSILIFPEGKHSEDDSVGAFQAGVGMMAGRLDVPVVPVRVRGVNRVLHPHEKMARPGRVTVTFGDALRMGEGESYADFSQRVEDAVKNL